MASRKEQKEEARRAREEAAAAREQSSKKRRRVSVLLAAVGIAAVVVVAAVIVSSSGGGSKGSPKEIQAINASYKGIYQNGTAVGNPTAKVTLVEFADLKCPICKKFSADTLPQIIDKYVRTGKVRMEFRALTFVAEASAPGDSLRAATMAESAGLQNLLWPFVEIFYLNQQNENNAYVDDAFLRKIGRKVDGLNVNQALADRSKPAVKASLATAGGQAREFNITGTPSFLIGKTGGQLTDLNNASLDFSEFSDLIDQELQ